MIKSFKQGAITWVVEQVDYIEDRCLGMCHMSQHKISISNYSGGVKISDEAKELTLYHEMVHVVLESIGRRDLSEDETLVESLSLMIHQFEKTKK